jgi:hypothetical protein
MFKLILININNNSSTCWHRVYTLENWLQIGPCACKLWTNLMCDHFFDWSAIYSYPSTTNERWPWQIWEWNELFLIYSPAKKNMIRKLSSQQAWVSLTSNWLRELNNNRRQATHSLSRPRISFHLSSTVLSWNWTMTMMCNGLYIH